MLTQDLLKKPVVHHIQGSTANYSFIKGYP